ncbi:hypothetical protein [Rhodococcus sp. OK302]|uniref:hypothetical protein n=1 Tax=Rhodococcus sp. OK302 TaxID=1882769 RepID=UPI000B944E5D|nr:hypothetical protein [Rhodococcus sp. OK302]OYD60821.1 hypothetical protein BDB13_5711 [Rhodococcus sp. OK302]
MHSTTGPSRSAGISGVTTAMLVACAVALAAAFVFTPGALAGRPGEGCADQGELIETVRAAFVGYWSSGVRAFSPRLEAVVDYWFRYYVAKAVIAAILLTVLFALGAILRKSFAKAGPLTAGKKIAFVSAGGLVTVLALFSSVLVMANVQGVIAPFASLMSVLPVRESDGELADALGQVRQQLAESTSAGNQIAPALDLMISDFARCHLAMAVIALIGAAVFIGASVVLWTKFARTARSSRRTRRVLGSIGALCAVFALGLIVVGVANTATAEHPAPALSAFFDGGL